MNRLLKQTLESCPPFNRFITEGFAKFDLADPMKLLDGIIKANLKPANNLGLEYLGYKALRPTEEYLDSIPNNPGQKVTLDVTVSDVKKYLIHLTYNGQNIYKTFWLPAPDDESGFRISGTKYYLAPVITNPIISYNGSGGGLFIKLYKDKLIAKSKTFFININGKTEFKDFVYFEEFFKLNRIGGRINPSLAQLETPISLITLCKLGLRETVKKYADMELGKDFIIFKGKPPFEHKDFDIITTTGKQNQDVAIPYPERHDIGFMINKKHSHRQFPYHLVYGLMYVFDAFPNRALEIFKKIDHKKETLYWKWITGEVMFKDAFTNDRIIESIEEHMAKIEGFIDINISERFAEIGLEVHDIYDFLAELTGEFNNYLNLTQQVNNSVKEKHIEVIYYILFNIIVEINKNMDDLFKQQRKGGITENNLNFVLRRTFSPKGIFNINKSGNQVLPITLFSTVSDNGIPKIYSFLELQERGRGVVKGSATGASKFPHNVRTLSGIDLFIGNVHYLPKHCPTPLIRLNPFSQWDEKFKPKLDPEMEKKIDTLDAMLHNRKDNPTTIEIEVDTIDEVD